MTRTQKESNVMAMQRYVFFWSACKGEVIHKGCLSQWQPCAFVVNGIQYSSAEQFMMAEKARLFGDQETLKKILSAKAPSWIKKLGRQVRGYDDKKWDDKKFGIVVQGNMAKFSQDPKLMAFLLGTEDATLVEASPLDCIWGVGLKESDKKILDQGQWKGKNLLGKALMEVRKDLARQNEREEIVKKNREEFVSGQRASVCVEPKEMKESVVRPDCVGPETDRCFVEQIKACVESSHVYTADGKDERKVQIKDRKTVEEFVWLYKPYVLGVLKKHCRFEFKNGRLVNGMLEAEDVFNQVVYRFFRNKELKNLDLFKEGAGKRPFRNYLRAIVQNVFYEMAGRDLVEEIGPDGKTVMVEKKDWKGRPIFETDEKGVVKMDGKGHPVVKLEPHLISRHVALEHVANLAWGEHKPTMWSQPPSNKHLQELLLDILTIAYISVHERKVCRDSWAYDAMAAVFERGESDKLVAKRLVKEGVINRVNTFEAAKSRFADKWHDAWMRLYKSIVKSGKGGMMEDGIMMELWRNAKERLGKSRRADTLRQSIAEWAFDYAERSMKKGADRHARHRY